MPADAHDEFRVSLLLTGPCEAGKSSILIKLTEKKFDPRYIPTIGINPYISENSIEGNTVKLQIWDTSGDQKFTILVKRYLIMAHGYFLVVDADHALSSSLEGYVSFLQAIKEYPEKPVHILVNTKKEMRPDDIKTATTNITTWLATQGSQDTPIHFCSAKNDTADELSKPFMQLAQSVLAKMHPEHFNEAQPDPDPAPASQRRPELDTIQTSKETIAHLNKLCRTAPQSEQKQAKQQALKDLQYLIKNKFEDNTRALVNLYSELQKAFNGKGPLKVITRKRGTALFFEHGCTDTYSAMCNEIILALAKNNFQQFKHSSDKQTFALSAVDEKTVFSMSHYRIPCLWRSPARMYLEDKIKKLNKRTKEIARQKFL